MTARELVVKLLLDARGVASGSAAAQQSLTLVSTTAQTAGDTLKGATDKAKSGLDGVSTAAKQAGNALKGAADEGATGFKQLTRTASRALAVLGGVAFFKRTAAQFFANADAVGRFSKALSQNAETMQAWGQAAARTGGSVQAFYSTVDSLGEKLRDVVKTGSGEAAGVLHRLGISPRESGRVKDTTSLLLELADVMKGMDQQKAMDYGKALGIDPGTIMLLQSGRREVEALVTRQKELFVYTRADAEMAQKANNAFADMGQALSGVAAVFMRVAAPALTWLAEKLTAIAVWARKNEPFVLAFFTGLAGVITVVALPAIKAFAAAVLTAAAPFLPLILIVVGLAIAIDDLVRYMRGGTSAFSNLWKQFGTGEEIAAKLGKAWEALQAIGKRLFSFLMSAVRTTFQSFGNGLDILISLYNWFKALINLDFEAMSRWGDEMLDAIMRNAAAVGNLIAEFLDMIGLWEPLKAGFTAAADAVLGAWETVKQWFQDFFGWVIDTWNSVKSIPGSIADSVSGVFDSAAGAISSGIDTVADFFGFGPESKEPSSVSTTQTTTRTTTIGQVVVQTQATDAQGIANDMGSALGNTVNQADGAFAF